MYNLNSTGAKKRAYYAGLPQDGTCTFCQLSEEEKIAETESFIVLRNLFGYDVFDLSETEDHLMVIPKKHTDNLRVLSDSERLELMNILIDYETKGYNVFFREPQSSVKTVDHHHTHLIKLGKRIKTLEYKREPYNMKYTV